MLRTVRYLPNNLMNVQARPNRLFYPSSSRCTRHFSTENSTEQVKTELPTTARGEKILYRGSQQFPIRVMFGVGCFNCVVNSPHRYPFVIFICFFIGISTGPHN